MATGSRGPPGVCAAMRSVPPGLIAPAAGAAVVATPAVVAAPAVVAGPAVVAAPAVVADDEPLLLPHAEMIAPMNGTVRPSTVPRRTNSRRLMRPCANDSMWSNSIGPTLRRAWSKSLKFIPEHPPRIVVGHSTDVYRIRTQVRPGSARTKAKRLYRKFTVTPATASAARQTSLIGRFWAEGLVELL